MGSEKGERAGMGSSSHLPHPFVFPFGKQWASAWVEGTLLATVWVAKL